MCMRVCMRMVCEPTTVAIYIIVYVWYILYIQRDNLYRWLRLRLRLGLRFRLRVEVGIEGWLRVVFKLGIEVGIEVGG